jgi:integrase
LAYDTLCRRSELITLRITDIQTRELANKAHHTILLRRGKVDQESHGRRLVLQSKTVLAINHWLSEAKINGGFILRAVKRNDRVSESLCSGQINRIYKRLAQQANIDPAIVQNISGHSCRVGAAQSLLASGASMPMIMNRGRLSKTDTAMRYLEQYGSGY